MFEIFIVVSISLLVTGRLCSAMKHEIYKEEHYVTGSNGFIGNHLCSVLLNFIRGSRTTVNGGAKHIVDLASYGNLVSQTDIEEIYKVNLYRVKMLLEFSKGYDSLILTSTSAIQQPKPNSYTTSKGLMEKFAMDFVHQRKLPIVVIRPSSVTGVGEQKEHLIPKLIRSCLYGEEMPFVESPVHDFIAVEDVVSAILFLEENIDNCKGRVWNVSTGVGYSNKEVKELVEKVIGKEANVKLVDSLREYDSIDWIVDNSQLVGLGWKPIKTLEETICSMVLKEKS